MIYPPCSNATCGPMPRTWATGWACLSWAALPASMEPCFTLTSPVPGRSSGLQAMLVFAGTDQADRTDQAD